MSSNRTRCQLILSSRAIAALSLLSTAPVTGIAAAAPPDTLSLTATIRDFQERTVPGGHPDFERNLPLGAGGVARNAVEPVLGPERKPIFDNPVKLTKTGPNSYDQWRDASGRAICWYVAEQYPRPGDVPGSVNNTGPNPFTSAPNFDQWYTDTLGVNISIQVPLTLERQADGSYLFDDKLDPYYSSQGGFFPIDGQLFGNSVVLSDHNYHFTTEIHAMFLYEAAATQVFRFVGDDDVWVFIDGRLVIDLGGTHSEQEQFLDLGRLGLVNGERYSLDLFHAERQTDKSNFRFQTTVLLVDAPRPTISAAFD